MAELEHSYKGTEWKNHKYIKKENGRYVYPTKTTADTGKSGRKVKKKKSAYNKNVLNTATSLASVGSDVISRLINKRTKNTPLNDGSYHNRYATMANNSLTKKYLQKVKDLGIEGRNNITSEQRNALYDEAYKQVRSDYNFEAITPADRERTIEEREKKRIENSRTRDKSRR